MTRQKKSPERAAARERGRLSHRSTSGPGFHFEDLVAAYLLAQALGGEPATGLGMPPTALQFQTRSLGWEIDDLLATSKGDSEARRVAYSCKSNIQVTDASLPTDFLAAAWLQWRQANPFQRETDSSALVSLGHNDRFEAAWALVKDWCSAGATDLACARLATSSRKVKRIVDGIRAAGGEGDLLPSVEETVEFIQRLHVMPVDLSRDNSRTLAEALRFCRQILDAESVTKAPELWVELVGRAGEARRTHGNIDIAQLWRELRRLFAFKEHPDYSHSWSRIGQLSGDHRDAVETELPSGHRIARTPLAARLANLLRTEGICVVFGDSGAGKSALVKTTLDQEFRDARQVWMGPEVLAEALSEAKRESLGLDRPLGVVLEHSSATSNVLIVDAAERLDAGALTRARALVERLQSSNGHLQHLWRIVIVGQTDSSDGRLQTLSGPAAHRVEVGPLEPNEVVAALRSLPALRPLAADPAVPRLLRNMRTLTLVMRASEAFSGAARPASHVDIADRLFEHWTEGRMQLQAFLIRLSIREAQFERSFAISELDPTDLVALDDAPAQFPLARKHGRIEFQDDLVPDWVRFERLKELSTKPEEWSKLAGEPLWIPALRFFGQFLLRQSERSTNAWDAAFLVARERELTSAADVLLDALCLDPDADSFLEARADLLFQDEAALLDRLLRRFLHVATVAQVPEALADPTLRFYLEGNIRVPIYGRWPPVLRFLQSEATRLGALGSETVARVCELWLRTTPVNLGDNVPMPFRAAVASLALANAETIWVQRAARHTFGGGKWGRTIYSAALSGAPDLPDAIAAFALQLANRRPWDTRIIARIAGMQEADRQAQEAALAADPERRRRAEERRRSPPPHSISFERDLPPWPLGATDRLDDDFRHSIVHGGSLKALMSALPDVAGEVLLACVIDDSPKETYSAVDFDRKLGLEFDSETSPAIYWKSPFYPFLQLAPDEARSAILRLVEFCTERWIEGISVQGDPPGVRLIIDQDQPRHYVGNWDVFDWGQASGYSAGQLYSALDALERWLCDRIEAGVDVSSDCLQLLRSCPSVSVIGVLTNVGKRQPSLLTHALRPLVAQPRLFRWDDHRLAHEAFRHDAFSWWRAGEVAAQMARDWTFAPHRRVSLKAVVRDLRRANSVFDQEFGELVSTWPQPDDADAALDQRMLAAELDPANWRWHDQADPAVSEYCSFHPPDDLQQSLEAVHASEQREPTASDILAHCRELLPQQGTLSDEYAAYLFDFLSTTGGPSDQFARAATRAALATTLLVKGWDWLAKSAPARAEAISAIVSFIEEEERGPPREREARFLWDQALALVVLAAANRLASGDEGHALWHRVIRVVVASGIPGAMATAVAALRLYRNQLPSLWLRTLKLGILVAALEALRPRYGDEDGAQDRLDRWRRRLRQWPIEDDDKGLQEWDLPRLGARVERIWRKRMLRLHARDDWRGSLRRRFSSGLDIPALQALFIWALAEDVEPPANEQAEHRLALGALWEFEAWNLCRDHEDEDEDETDELSQVSQLGISVIRVIASRTAVGPFDEWRVLWEPILGLGARGGFNVEHFIDCFFLRLYKEHDPTAFVAAWRSMLATVFEPTWKAKGRWYRARDIRKHLLGFNASNQLTHSPAVLNQIVSLLEYYRAFASQDLTHDDSAIAALSYFLSSDAGRVFRMEGVRWLEAAATASGRLRSDTTAALTQFADTLISEHDAELLADQDTRTALIRMVATLVEAQAPLALALQERLRSLR